MKIMNSDRIVVAGAGAVGCFVGGLLAASGRPVTLLGRASILDPIAANGLALTDFSGLDAQIAAESLTLSENPECLCDAGVILVAVKTPGSPKMAIAIGANAAPEVPVVSLQNGMDAVAALESGLPGRRVLPSVVGFNVVQRGPARFHRATGGELLLPRSAEALELDVAGLEVRFVDDIVAHQWGKLLLNLTNALNALSGLTIREQLLSRPWRGLLADQMAEGLAVLRRAGKPVQSGTPLPPGAIPGLLRLPTPLFRVIAARMLAVDAEARTSMVRDFEAGRPTEVDSLQGALVRLGKAQGVPTPICSAVLNLVRSGEGQQAPRRYSVAEIRKKVKAG